MQFPPFRIPKPRKMSVQEGKIRRELAFRRLKHLGADIEKPAVREVVEMIYRNSHFRVSAEKIVEASMGKIIDSLPKKRAGTKAKSFLKKHHITDVEGSVRLCEADIKNEYGFGPETAEALKQALKENRLEFEMLFPKPLSEIPND